MNHLMTTLPYILAAVFVLILLAKSDPRRQRLSQDKKSEKEEICYDEERNVRQKIEAEERSKER